MNITITLLVLFAVLVPAVTWLVFKARVQWQIALTICLVSIGIIFAALYVSKSHQASDIEVLNGQVASKNSEQVSCEHSYDCNCRKSCSGSGSSESCSTTCDICYDHSYDVSWRVHTSVGTFDIDRINRRGDDEPPRYSKVLAGDPVAKTQSYTNWVKAVPNSLFHHKGTFAPQLASLVPAYPVNVYDYHYLDRVLTVQVPVIDLAGWNKDLANMLRPLGPSKQANVVIVMVKTSDPNYEYALRTGWEGGKKNDVVIILGITSYPKIEWVRIMSWTDKQLFKVQLRDDLIELGTVEDRAALLKIISTDISKMYERKRMRDFEYLSDEITPPNWLIIGIILVIIIANSVMVYMAYNYQPSHRHFYASSVRPYPLRSQRARFSLIEVMIGLAMFSIIIAIVYPLIF